MKIFHQVLPEGKIELMGVKVVHVLNGLGRHSRGLGDFKMVLLMEQSFTRCI